MLCYFIFGLFCVTFVKKRVTFLYDMGQDDEGYGNEIYGHSQWLLGRLFID